MGAQNAGHPRKGKAKPTIKMHGEKRIIATTLGISYGTVLKAFKSQGSERTVEAVQERLALVRETFETSESKSFKFILRKLEAMNLPKLDYGTDTEDLRLIRGDCGYIAKKHGIAIAGVTQERNRILSGKPPKKYNLLPVMQDITTLSNARKNGNLEHPKTIIG